MYYRIKEVIEEVSQDGELYLNQKWLKSDKQYYDLNKIYQRVELLEGKDKEGDILYTVEEYEPNADILDQTKHIKGCARHGNGLDEPRQWNGRCTCAEVKVANSGTKMNKEEWRQATLADIEELKKMDDAPHVRVADDEVRDDYAVDARKEAEPSIKDGDMITGQKLEALYEAKRKQ